jgi:hypothetical protein
MHDLLIDRVKEESAKLERAYLDLRDNMAECTSSPRFGPPHVDPWRLNEEQWAKRHNE